MLEFADEEEDDDDDDDDDNDDQVVQVDANGDPVPRQSRIRGLGPNSDAMDRLRRAGPLARLSWIRELYPTFATTGGEISVIQAVAQRGKERHYAPVVRYLLMLI